MVERLAATRGTVVYVPDVTIPQISSEDRHHLQRVVRARPGDRFVMADGRGAWRHARFGPSIAFDGEVVHEDLTDPALTLSVALPKGDRADWLIQKATEIGIDSIVVIEAERSVVRWGGRAERSLERLGRIARAAAAQSRRAWLPTIEGPVGFEAVVGETDVSIAHPGGGPIAPACRNVVIGPEGGWSEREVAMSRSTVNLGSQVLRVETAALVASTLLVALRSRLVLPSDGPPENAHGG